jgi:hypothetical protein
MAITSAGLETFTVEGTGTDPQDISVTYSLTYVVNADTDTTASEVRAYFRDHSNLPWHGRTLRCDEAIDTAVVCETLTVTPTPKSARKFVVGAKCVPSESQTKGKPTNDPENDSTNTRNPLFWHDQISLSSQPLSMPLTSARFREFGGSAEGKEPKLPLKKGFMLAVMNSAGVPFDAVPDTTRPIRVIRITRNISITDFTLWRQQADALNDTVNSRDYILSKPLYGFHYFIPKYRGLFVGPQAEYSVDNNVGYWRCTAEVHIHPKSWRLEILDKGLHRAALPGMKREDGTVIVDGQSVPAEGPHISAIHDEHGDPITAPVLLDGRGAPLKEGLEPATLIYSDYPEVFHDNFNWGK